MDCLRLCRAQTGESGFAPGPSEGADGLYHGVQSPSAHHVENPEVRRTPRCLVLRGVSPVRGGWGRDGADVGPGFGRRWCSSSTVGILRMGKNGSHGSGIGVPIEGAGAFQIRRPCFPSRRPDAFVRALSSSHTSSAECPVRVGGFTCRASYWGLW